MIPSEMREVLVLVFHDGRVTSLVRSAGHSLSVFGGPLEAELRGRALVRPLHHIATLSHVHLAALGGPTSAWDLPLVYGLLYSGCSLRYRFESDAIELESIEPEAPTPQWPYSDYPQLLPYVPLEVGAVHAATWADFRRRAPGLSAQQPADVVVLVPPPAGLGVSLWGRSGDAENVTLVFECSLENRRVVASNVCS